MGEWLIAMVVAFATYAWGRWDGARIYERELAEEIEAGRSPAARAMQAAMRQSPEIDR